MPSPANVPRSCLRLGESTEELGTVSEGSEVMDGVSGGEKSSRHIGFADGVPVYRGESTDTSADLISRHSHSVATLSGALSSTWFGQFDTLN